MLTPEERQEINAELTRYPTKQAVCIEALKVVQRHRGWVSTDGLKDIGDALDMTPEELIGLQLSSLPVIVYIVGHFGFIDLRADQQPSRLDLGSNVRKDTPKLVHCQQ
jgi:Thioredoxin-like [2Fe-2S] ferredoxin